MKLQIKSRFDSSVILYEGEAESILALLNRAVTADADLINADLTNVDLSSAIGFGSNLSGSNLSGADLTDADLSGADLTDANLTDANLACANLTGANLSGSNLSGSNLSGANLRGADLPYAPKIENLDSKILEAIEAGGDLNMGEWHTCETTHCRAGWAIQLAGDAGRLLEEQHGAAIAGTLIYQASTGRVPDFHASNEEALADIKRCAANTGL